MPLLRIDLIEGRTDAGLKALLDALHAAMLAAFKVPERDRYQIVHEHPPTRMIVEDTASASRARTRSWSSRSSRAGAAARRRKTFIASFASIWSGIAASRHQT